jgi:hypothetical protein
MPTAEITITPGNMLTVNPNWLEEKRAEISRGEESVKALSEIPGVSKWRITKARARLNFIKRYVDLVSQGFIPIPRMEFEQIELASDRSWDGKTHIYLDKMPVQALKNIAEFRPLFDEVGIVKPVGKKRDPILIGIIRHGQREEHFILYFWRPELYSESELW